MKTQEVQNKVERIGDLPEQSFKIKASAASFQILSSGLYSNKIRAIIRELCCNAYDSHKAAGKQDIPFEISLPSSFSPLLVIKDFGVGLSHQEVLTIFTTYFESTKGDSDDFIGQLGLGSKSPFSYTSQFLVESRQNGKVNTYSMFISESGVPAVSHMGVSDTDEDNGLTITITVKQSDFYKFKEESEYVLKYFTPYPVITGTHNRQEFEYKMIKDKFAIRNEVSYYSSIPNVIQGFVSYPIDVEQLNSYVSEDHMLTEEARALLYAPIDLFVPIGMVQVAPSREHLSYDKKTIGNIISFFNEVAAEIIDNLQEMIDECETLWDARVVVNGFMDHRSVFRKLYDKIGKINGQSAYKFNYKGTPVYNSFMIYDVDVEDNVSIVVYNRGNSSYRNRRVQKTIFHPQNLKAYKKMASPSYSAISIDSATSILINDDYTSAQKIKDYVEHYHTQGDAIIEIRASIKSASIQNTKNDFINKVGIDINSSAIQYTSDLNKSGKIVKNQVVKQAKITHPIESKIVYTCIGNGSYTQKRESVSLSDGGIYIKTYRSQWVSSFDDGREKLDMYFNRVSKFLSSIGALKQGDKIVEVGSRDIKKFENSGNWIDFVTFLDNSIKNNKEDIISTIKQQQLHVGLTIPVIRFSNNLINEYPNDNFDKLKDILNSENLLSVLNVDKASKIVIDNVLNIGALFNILTKESQVLLGEFEEEYTKEINYINVTEKIENMYPLMGELIGAKYYYYTALPCKTEKCIVDYIHLMDSKEEVKEVVDSNLYVC